MLERNRVKFVAAQLSGMETAHLAIQPMLVDYTIVFRFPSKPPTVLADGEVHLGQDHEFLARKVQLFDRISEDDFGFSI